MGRVPYDPEQCIKAHKMHYGTGIPVFRGEFNQQGSGLGNMLAGLARRAIPLLTPIAKTVGKEILKTGGQVLTDVLTGKDDIKSSAKKRVSNAIVERLNKKSRKSNKRQRSNDVFDTL